MTPNTIVLLCVIALGISVILSFKFKLNLGILGFFFAFIIGYMICGNSINKILGYWPYKVIFTLMALPLFFGYAAQNGSVDIIAGHLIYRFRNFAWASPIAIFLVSILVSTLGAGNFATVTFLGPIAYAICSASGVNPLINVGVPIAATIGAGMYWAGGAATTASLIEGAGADAETANHIGIMAGFNQILIGIALLVVLYVCCKGWKAKNIEVSAPPKANKQQKTTLIIMFFVVGIALLSMLLYTFVKNPVTKWMSTYLDVRVLCIIASVLCSILKLGDEKQVVRMLPWNTIFMITGVGLLMGIAQANGLSDILAKWITGNIPLWLIPAAFVVIAGLMSMFASALSVVYPVLMPIAVSLCAANPSLGMTELMTAILVGGALTGISPFSTGGSMLLATCSDTELRDSLVPKQFLFTFVLLFVSGALTLLGVLKLVK